MVMLKMDRSHSVRPPRHGTTMFEALESRTHLSFSAHINFQPEGAPTVPHYRADNGSLFGRHKNGLTYGWSIDNRSHAVDRNSSISPNQRFDTFNLLNQGLDDYKWEIAVPNGTYNMRILAGDARAKTGFYKIAAENVWVTNRATDAKHRWTEGTALVTVTDGRLTISRAALNSAGAINSIDIQSAGNLNAKFFDGVALRIGTD